MCANAPDADDDAQKGKGKALALTTAWMLDALGIAMSMTTMEQMTEDMFQHLPEGLDGETNHEASTFARMCCHRKHVEGTAARCGDRA